MPPRRTIFDILKKEHAEVRALLDKLAQVRPGLRERTFGRLFQELMAHAEAEEQVLYRRLRDVEPLRAPILEAAEEHRLVKSLLKELDRQAKDTDRWAAKLAVLKEVVEHHVEEEEGAVFDRARAALDPKEQVALAGSYLEQKHAVAGSDAEG